MNNVAIDVVLGLVFIFLLYSLLATILQEFIAQIFDLRAGMLIKTIRTLLDDRKNTKSLFLIRWWTSFKETFYYFFSPLEDNKFSKAFYSHPSVKYLAATSWSNKPSYIASFNFSNTLIALLRGKDYKGTESQMNAIYQTLFEQPIVSDGSGNVTTNIEPETLVHLRQLYIDSQKDIDKFRGLLENWFDETMERAGGWYKKQTQKILLLIGLAIAIAFNIDTIAIARLLANDRTARENMVQLAIQETPKYESFIQRIRSRSKPKTDSAMTTSKDTVRVTRTITDTVYVENSNKYLDSAYRTVRGDMTKAGNILGLGWAEDTCKVYLALMKKKETASDKCSVEKEIKDHKKIHHNPYQKWWFSIFIGWVITAFAISLGAPFWFDILNKVIQLRSSIAKPKNADTGGGSSKLNDNSSAVKPVG